MNTAATLWIMWAIVHVQIQVVLSSPVTGVKLMKGGGQSDS